MLSSPERWKRELTRLAKRIERMTSRRRWGPSYNFPFERDLFLAAFIVRKLIEHDQFSRRDTAKTVDVMFYPAQDLQELRDSVRHFTHRYQMMKGQMQRVIARDLMNQIIHSYYFSPFVAPEFGVYGLFVSSDKVRKIGLYYVTLPRLAVLISDFARSTEKPSVPTKTRKATKNKHGKTGNTAMQLKG